MMWGYGQNLWWMWLWGVLLLVGVAALVLLAIRVFGGNGRGWGSAPGGPEHPGAWHPGQYGPPPGGTPPGAQPPGGLQGHPGAAPATPGRSQARLILDERFARGELTPEQYREHVKELGEGS